jgi:hypothetical protein
VYPARRPGLQIVETKADQAVLIEVQIIIEVVAKKPVKLDFTKQLKPMKYYL